MEKPVGYVQGQWTRIGILAGLLWGFGLRLYQLGVDSLWYDETVSAFLAAQSLPELIAHTAGDIHPPGYYVLLHFWQALSHPKLAQGMEFWLAWPSLWFGLLILALLFALGRRFFGVQTGAWAVWVAAVNPFQIWYSQEVRMYTLGAFLGLLCLWAAWRWLDQIGRNQPKTVKAQATLLAIYSLSAAAGMYTLYYFAFLLITLNGLIFYELFSTVDRSWQRLAQWLTAQLVALLLWMPWLPIAWRQVTDPPVPPWRAPWHTVSEFITTVAESLATLLVGQSPPDGSLWVWAIVVLLIGIAVYGYTKKPSDSLSALRPQTVLLLYILAPLGLIYALSLLATPLYHVRYLFTYAPPFAILSGALLVWLSRRSARVALLLALGYFLVSTASLVQFWSNPIYRADDHRQAVATLAEQWRPGDAILVNAGWTYTALAVYWPSDLAAPTGALVPALNKPSRLTAFTSEKEGAATDLSFSQPLPVVSGSIDGPSTLGWGDPNSDFYPISQIDTELALTRLAAHSRRIWHYRLYDTVSDPQALIRQWLERHTTQRLDQPIPGRDFGRLQLYETMENPQDMGRIFPDRPLGILFDNQIGLVGFDPPLPVSAGSMLFVTTQWIGIANPPDSLSASLRIYDQGGHLLAQTDGALSPPTSSWIPGERHIQTFALSIPAALPPGEHPLQLLIYRQNDGQPLIVHNYRPAWQQMPLGNVTVLPASTPQLDQDSLARFDYIDLLDARMDWPGIHGSDSIELRLVWQPGPSPYKDSYGAVLELRDEEGNARGQWSDPLGGWAYPSGEWPANRPVMEWKDLPLSEALPPGQYSLHLGVERLADGQVISAQSARFPWRTQPSVPVSTLTVEGSP